MVHEAKRDVDAKKPSLAAKSSLQKKPAKMSHLYLKRFADTDDLTPGAQRNRMQQAADVIVDLAPTGRASCKQCGDVIRKSSVRFVLMLQCHKGYKMAAPVHGKDPNCFAVHVESSKLADRNEAFVKANVLGKENVEYAWSEIDAAIARDNGLKCEAEEVTGVLDDCSKMANVKQEDEVSPTIPAPKVEI